MNRVYKHPPLIEAICEVRFAPDVIWDMTIFGRFYDKISSQFPDRQQQVHVQTSFPGSSQESSAQEIVEPRMRFAKSDKSALLQLAPHRLIVNQLAPYTSWVDFKSLILQTLTQYQSVTEASTIERIGLRYINRFAFPSQNFRIGNWFAETSYLPAALLPVGLPYFVRLEFPFDEHRRVFLTTATLDEKMDNPDQQGVLLDIDCLTISPYAGKGPVEKVLEDGHAIVEQIFESFLTADLRMRLNMEGESQ